MSLWERLGIVTEIIEPNYSERMEMGGLNADNHRDIATKSSRGKETPRRGQDTLEIWDDHDIMNHTESLKSAGSINHQTTESSEIAAECCVSLVYGRGHPGISSTCRSPNYREVEGVQQPYVACPWCMTGISRDTLTTEKLEGYSSRMPYTPEVRLGLATISSVDKGRSQCQDASALASASFGQSSYHREAKDCGSKVPHIPAGRCVQQLHHQGERPTTAYPGDITGIDYHIIVSLDGGNTSEGPHHRELVEVQWDKAAHPRVISGTAAGIIIDAGIIVRMVEVRYHHEAERGQMTSLSGAE
ncbi:hypothetical protein CPB86DRAFT_799265 [Serendipita vermifera]|nr:hypothetical protein CPB86DRAFT_799265 [Serendipita vermifera]